MGLGVDKLKESVKFRVWLGIVLVAALFSILVAISISPKDFFERPSTDFVKEEATLVIDFGDGGKRLFAGSTIEGMNVYHALFASSRAGGFEVKITPGKDGVRVDEIDGVKNTEDKKWHYYFNREYRDMFSPQAQPLKSGDKVEFKYE